MTPSAQTNHEMSALADQTIKQLVEIYPEMMTVLGPLGIDLCCGGAHPLGEALDLHGIEREPVLRQVAAIVAAAPVAAR